MFVILHENSSVWHVLVSESNVEHFSIGNTKKSTQRRKSEERGNNSSRTSSSSDFYDPEENQMMPSGTWKSIARVIDTKKIEFFQQQVDEKQKMSLISRTTSRQYSMVGRN